jgi:hypothetical protein
MFLHFASWDSRQEKGQALNLYSWRLINCAYNTSSFAIATRT